MLGRVCCTKDACGEIFLGIRCAFREAVGDLEPTGAAGAVEFDFLGLLSRVCCTKDVCGEVFLGIRCVLGLTGAAEALEFELDRLRRRFCCSGGVFM